MKNQGYAGWSLVLVCYIMLHFTTVLAQSRASADLVAGAKKEGRLVWYTTLNVQQAQVFLKQFELKYPFIKTDVYRSVSNNILNRAIADSNAGKVAADVITMGGFQSYFLKKRGLTAPIARRRRQPYPRNSKTPKVIGSVFIRIRVSSLITPEW